MYNVTTKFCKTSEPCIFAAMAIFKCCRHGSAGSPKLFALLRKVNVVNGKILGQRAEALSTLFAEHGVNAFLRLYAAFGEALGALQDSAIPDSGNSGSNGQTNDADSVDNRDSFLYKIDQWHIFPPVNLESVLAAITFVFQMTNITSFRTNADIAYVTRSEDYLQKLRKYNIDIDYVNSKSLRRAKHNKHGGIAKITNCDVNKIKSILKQPTKP